MAGVKDSYREFWEYLSPTQQDLILEGQYLMNDVIKEGAFEFKDYSFLVFPFAKAYEGFLKQIFKDMGFISRLDYISDHLRLGKLMSPNLEMRLGQKSLYKKIKERVNMEFADKVWMAWKKGRNQIFHYFPHNLKRINFQEAENFANDFVRIMEEVFSKLNPKSAAVLKKLSELSHKKP